MNIAKSLIILLLMLSSACINSGKKHSSDQLLDPQVVQEIFVDSVWAANGTGFSMQTTDKQQFVAYYDRNRMMTVASRELGSTQWIKCTLDNQLMWDSHNYVVLAVDNHGYIHVSGNMHVHPLAYFRSAKPFDVSSMVAVHSMVGMNEQRVTYPSFYFDKEGELYYSYRCGTCGDGDIIVNKFVPEAGEWQRFLEEPLFEGVEVDQDRAAYHKKIKDDNGVLHFLWMWRWTPQVETCHNLCYAKTTDMKHWTNAAGEAVTMPFKPDDAQVAVDPVPSKGGLHNSRFRLILTQENEPIIAYVKYDEVGNTQLYLAKFVDDVWLIKQISDWDFRWEFIEGGAFMTQGAVFSFAGISEDGLLAIDWSTETNARGRYTIDVETLEHSDKMAIINKLYPDNISDNLTDVLGMNVKMTTNIANDGSRYVLKWETLHGGFSQHAPQVIPEGPLSPLVVLKVQ